MTATDRIHTVHNHFAPMSAPGHLHADMSGMARAATAGHDLHGETPSAAYKSPAERWAAIERECEEIGRQIAAAESRMLGARRAAEDLETAQRLREELFGASFDAYTAAHTALGEARGALADFNLEAEGRTRQLAEGQDEALAARRACVERHAREADVATSASGVADRQASELAHYNGRLRAAQAQLQAYEDSVRARRAELTRALGAAAREVLQLGELRLRLQTWSFQWLESRAHEAAITAGRLDLLRQEFNARVHSALAIVTRHRDPAGNGPR